MPVHIGRMDTEIEVMPERNETAVGGGTVTGAGNSPVLTDQELRERMRPIVIEIMEEELARFMRERG